MLNTLLKTDLIGGWITKLIESIEKPNVTHYLKGIELKRKNKREVRHNLYVCERYIYNKSRTYKNFNK